MHALRGFCCAAGPLLAVLSTGSEAVLLQAQTPYAHHALRVALEPATHRLVVTDTLTIPSGRPSLEFLLNGRLRITKSSAPADEVPVGDVAPFLGINSDPVPETVRSSGALLLKRYRLRTAPAGGVFTLEYSGVMDFPLSAQKEEYTRGFRQTPGIVSSDGVYLSGGSFWYPHFGQDLLTFDVEARQPVNWHVISQGSGTSRDAEGIARWTSREPMDEIYLVGGPLLVSRDRAGAVETLVYLHEKDEALASKYLTTTAQYLEMYSRMIGPYPYDKFALVENFWETGYGMPTFTLLGREIIRFPFILHSSYPHEILHNWWGNSVFVEYGSGNWSEGLTSYLADHLVQEQRKRGADYRRAALQKYRDYVKDGRDFALAEFRSRDSAATEAVGYGKTMMTFHMLRKRMGDERFTTMLAQLYRDYKGRRASWKDVERVSSSAAGTDLATFFADWTVRPGAPAFDARIEGVSRREGGYLITGTLRQTQEGPPFHLTVPVVVETERGFTTHPVTVSSQTAAIAITTADRPLTLHLDPYFDVFRRLDPRETPPSISQVFGASRVVAVLPSRAPAATLNAYRELLKGWQTATHTIDIKLDSDIQDLPAATAVWLLGRDNRLAAPLLRQQAGLEIEDEGLRIDGQSLPASNHTVVVITRHPQTPDHVVGWIVADPIEALPGLGRKLPHYGKYSYVGFEGVEPTNMLTGEWRQADSPMRVDLRAFVQAGDIAQKALPPDPANPLAELPPVFSRSTMTDTIATLARALAAADKPSRNIVFVAFAGEEAGLAGSRHFASVPSPFPLDITAGRCQRFGVR